jgi:uncharacterized protein (TIGR03032 family)
MDMTDPATPEQMSSNHSQMEPERTSAVSESLKAKPAQAAKSYFEFACSRQFTAWLAEHNISLACTTYLNSQLMFISHNRSPGIGLETLPVIHRRPFARAMGLFVSSERLWLSTLFQIWRLDNINKSEQIEGDYDRCYLPTMAYTTGDLDSHDIAVDREGRVVFVNTLYSCLATLAEGFSFEPIWRPPFITKLAAEDRCHLNGLAMRNGEPAYVTAMSRSDVAGGWRDRRRSGGILLDVANGKIVLEGLSMPHSPRWYKDRLWLLESGTGYFGYADFERGRFEPVTFCPGYVRGLAFYKNFAVVGLSEQRESKFDGTSLLDNLAARDAEPRCGIMIVDLDSGDVVHQLRFDKGVGEIYDVDVLPGIVRPMVIGAGVDEIRRVIRVKSAY